jgi:serine/threonine protein kinase
MPKLKAPIILETTFGEYTVHEQLGEGGAGRVFGGIDDTGAAVAVKVLTQFSRDKMRRFKNEIGFLTRHRHGNVVAVIDNGLVKEGKITGPFYVMHRYAGSLRDLMDKRIPSDQVLPLFSQILDGVESAHFQNVVHRDLKPENILHSAGKLAVADFGIASFTEDQLVTVVETLPTQRLANFQYAAPEQRVPGQQIMIQADIYALGLMLNEMFTGAVPHGTDYRKIVSIAPNFGFLDAIVEQMIRQSPGDRPSSVSNIKTLIQRHQYETVALQRLSEISQTVIKAGEIDDPLAFQPPSLTGAEWSNGTLILTLDRPVNEQWVNALQTMGNYTSVMGIPPQMFRFRGTTASVSVGEGDAQQVINYFKAWLPNATANLRYRLQMQAQEDERVRRDALRVEREAEERRLRVNRNLKI